MLEHVCAYLHSFRQGPERQGQPEHQTRFASAGVVTALPLQLRGIHGPPCRRRAPRSSCPAPPGPPLCTAQQTWCTRCCWTGRPGRCWSACTSWCSATTRSWAALRQHRRASRAGLQAPTCSSRSSRWQQQQQSRRHLTGFSGPPSCACWQAGCSAGASCVCWICGEQVLPVGGAARVACGLQWARA